MSSEGQFVGQILETSAAGYAGLAAGLLIERHPEIARHYEPNAYSSWNAQIRRWLLDLAAAIEAGEPGLFEARMLWTRKAFAARQSSVEDLQAALAALRDVLRERLPPGSADSAAATVERALAAVTDTSAGEAAEPEPHPPPGPTALSYLEKILAGRPDEAIEQVLEAIDGRGPSVKAAYLEVLIPALREVGRLWHAGELSIAEEHAVTAITQRTMALLCERARSPRSSAHANKTALFACVAGNMHDLGIRAVSDFFEMAGWRTIFLGSDVPHAEIARAVQSFGADVVLLAATLDPHLKEVQRTIERMRAQENRDVKVIVGGPAFATVPDLWRKVGADGYSARIEEAEPLASRLAR
jgi:methanogenic corrinoid protein MtbC1